ncbi:natural resistance-associated macrophage protein [Xylona heveae TC161]|uniref:Natural resistance-associated macrophage protein n=1 Tax=Xylona heveae (strain CBS 132557 / TC161) TaxID=1328760 RepID=A0A161TFU7_XYLHT|nr:natural resistance-associated macrophage protein [Xylona heveae TC161]KZF24957.1 natural resistance-associated macrophage protein [Xylona heveae TC161]
MDGWKSRVVSRVRPTKSQSMTQEQEQSTRDCNGQEQEVDMAGNNNNGINRREGCLGQSSRHGQLQGGENNSRGNTAIAEEDNHRRNGGAEEEEENNAPGGFKGACRRTLRSVAKFAKFLGPGFLVSVAYIDPGNYSTDAAAGASYRFRLLFIILMSNVFAIFLQSLCIKLGTITGMDLAENCRIHLPKWMNLTLYVFAEAAIIATDIAEVIGSAIALNILIKVPLVAGCALTLVDVLLILVFYNPKGTMNRLRAFEFFVCALVIGVVICFCIQLSLIKGVTVGEVLKGYLPSKAIVESQGLYQSCGILGATVMPHSLYLGSGVVQSRLRDFDIRAGNFPDPAQQPSTSEAEGELRKYRPSLAAIRSCLSYSVAELVMALFSFALFVNSAILIVAGASLSSTPNADEADLFEIHDILSRNVSPGAGTVFALALLLSGTSAGIVCTIAGQMVSEGAINWTIAPWLRRLITRTISILPSIVIAAAVGRRGLTAALNGSQVALSVILPFVTAPLIYFTCRGHIMTVAVNERAELDHGQPVESSVETPNEAHQTLGIDDGAGNSTVVSNARDAPATGPPALAYTDESEQSQPQTVHLQNNWVTSIIAFLIWLVIAVMNVALLVLVGMGKA